MPKCAANISGGSGRGREKLPCPGPLPVRAQLYKPTTLTCRDGLSGIFCNMSLGVILRVLDGEMDQFMPKNSYKVPARRSSERTRLIFLDAAEKIFSERGYEGTTIRAICEAAEVQLGALSYYWGSKSTMFQDVAERRLRPIMEERLERMDAVAVATGGAPALSEILDAFYQPMIDAAQNDDDGTFVKFLLRMTSEPAPDVVRAYRTVTDEATFRFIRLMRKACSHLDDETFFWRLSSVMGGMMYALSHRSFVSRLMAGIVQSPSLVTGARECLTGFIALLEAPDKRESTETRAKADRRSAARAGPTAS